MSFFVYVIFLFQFRITWLFGNVLFGNIQKLIWMIIYLDLISLSIRLILFWLLLNLFLLAPLLVCLLTLSLSINIKHLCLFFHSLLILTNFLKFWPPCIYFYHPHPPPPCLLNLTKISDPPLFYFDLPQAKLDRTRKPWYLLLCNFWLLLLTLSRRETGN